MGVSLILLRRARTGIALSRCGWVCVYAPMWPGTSFWGYPSLDLRPEMWVGECGGVSGYRCTAREENAGPRISRFLISFSPRDGASIFRPYFFVVLCPAGPQ